MARECHLDLDKCMSIASPLREAVELSIVESECVNRFKLVRFEVR